MSQPNTQPRLSCRVENLHASPIREILSVIDRADMISFAGGLPAPESFPSFSLDTMPSSWLQYGTTEGEPALRQRVAEDMQALGLQCDPEQVLILSGSQQGIDLVAKLFIDTGTPVAVESPTYLAALQVFRFFGARFVPLNPRQAHAGLSGGERPAFAYAIPSFQNPTGHCYSSEERESLALACEAQGIPLFEDDPYRDLAYDLCDRRPVCARLKRTPWIYQSSFSKSLAPGLRLGFLVASPDLMPSLVRLKQAADLHSNRVSQWLVLQQLQDPGRQARLARLVDTYRLKRDFFAQELERHFTDIATWKMPSGGLFFWLQLKRTIDTRNVLPEAIRRGVAFMPGEPFFPEIQKASGALRLSFSHANKEHTAKGLEILASLLRSSEKLTVASQD